MFASQQVADAGDLAVNPFSIGDAIAAIERARVPCWNVRGSC